jgi:hypothetical protein
LAQKRAKGSPITDSFVITDYQFATRLLNRTLEMKEEALTMRMKNKK